MSESAPMGKKKSNVRTIKGLRLDTESAIDGKVWKLLPDGYRAQECGKTYPLPTSTKELQRLAAIALPIRDKQSAGCIYLNRAICEWKKRQRNRNSAILDVGQRTDSIAKAEIGFRKEIESLKEAAKQAVEGVQKEAEEASASLKDLFHLGRKGLDGQMRAHLDGADWHDETISAKAFRDCFSMVTTAVKGLGIPTDQRKPAQEAIFEEAAAAIKASREIVRLGPGDDTDTEH